MFRGSDLLALSVSEGQEGSAVGRGLVGAQRVVISALPSSHLQVDQVWGVGPSGPT